MLLGYNTNGLAHHEPMSALELLAETGYECVALSLDHFWLNPFSPNLAAEQRRFQKKLEELHLQVVIETGARFLLDARRKHWPSLTADPSEAMPRIDFLTRACQIASHLGGQVVSIWSGHNAPGTSDQTALDNLSANLDLVLEAAEKHNVVLGFEPEPGMFIDNLKGYFRLQEWRTHPRLKLTMDIGHLFCNGELPISDQIQRWRSDIVNVHIEDMRAGVHDHLKFGDGEISFPPVIHALREIGYSGPCCVELSRHSFDAVNAVRDSYAFLKSLISGNG
jgi:sugar phosphate isomerase/epimerase